MLMKADPSWCLVLERIHPASLDEEFTAIEFELAFVINIRAALWLVEATPACRRFAEVAISNAVNYSCFRHSRRSTRVLADAQRAVDEALWRFVTELGSCKMKAKATPESTSVYSTQKTYAGMQSLRFCDREVISPGLPGEQFLNLRAPGLPGPKACVP